MFYFIALIPLIIGGILWIFNKHINVWEWAIGSALAFLTALIFQCIAVSGMTHDIETWSGQIIKAKQFSSWQEYYEYAVYRTEYYTVSVSNSNGKGSHSEMRSRQVFDHWQPSTRWHEASWASYSDLPTSYDIDQYKFYYFTNRYQMCEPVAGERETMSHNSRMIAGDPNDYEATPIITRWVEPVTIIKSWKNRIKAAPSVFSFAPVPTNIPVFNWPENPNVFVSDRVMGTAKKYISTIQWDKLNAVLGPTKKINLIIVGFDSSDAMLGQYQKAKWIGGKKNDLVITLGGKDLHHPDWCLVYGWSDSDVAKADITSYIIQNGLNTNLFTFLSKEIISNYKIKEWKDFDYLNVEPAPIYTYWYIVILILTQTGIYLYFSFNEFDKENNQSTNTWNGGYPKPNPPQVPPKFPKPYIRYKKTYRKNRIFD